MFWHYYGNVPEPKPLTLNVMKINNYNTLCLLALIVLIAFPVELFSQQNRGETKKEKKEREKQEKLESYNEARQILLDSCFIIPVNSVRLKGGSVIPVAVGTTNYLKVVGDDVVLQYASGYSAYSGANGLGGGTLVGKMRELKIVDNEKKNRFFMTFILFGSANARISISINGSDVANIDVDRVVYGRAFSLVGEVQNPDAIKTIQGTPF